MNTQLNYSQVPIGMILSGIVRSVAGTLRQISDQDASVRPAPEKWSPKELVGHLIDSATNNHRRIVIGALKDDLIFEGYQQESWVRVQNYQNREWVKLVTTWANYNLHIARTIDELPVKILLTKRARHNFHEILWKPVPAKSPSTLNYLIKDYIGHLEHHVQQILPDYAPVMIGTYGDGSADDYKTD